MCNFFPRHLCDAQFDCLFANPAIHMTMDAYEETPNGDPSGPGANYIRHSLLINEYYLKAVNSYANKSGKCHQNHVFMTTHAQCFLNTSKSTAPSVIYQIGKQSMTDSSSHHPSAGWMGGAVCQTAGDLVEQMEETCGYKDNEDVYANAAVLMIQGALEYVSPGLKQKASDCSFDLGGIEGQTFQDEYGHLLSNETKEFLAVCVADD